MNKKLVQIGANVKECKFERIRRLVKWFNYSELLQNHRQFKKEEDNKKVLKRLLIGYAVQYKWVPKHIPREQIIKYLAHLGFTLEINDGTIIPCLDGEVRFIKERRK